MKGDNASKLYLVITAKRSTFRQLLAMVPIASITAILSVKALGESYKSFRCPTKCRENKTKQIKLKQKTVTVVIIIIVI